MARNPKYDKLRSMEKEEFLSYVERACTREHLAFLLGATSNVRLVHLKMVEFGVTSQVWEGRMSPRRKVYREARQKAARNAWVKKFESEVLPNLLIENCDYHPNVARQYIKRYNSIFNWIPYYCEDCGSDGSWMGKRLSLQLDHRNGKNDDNRVENLRYLCPNCHALTDSFAGKNIGKNSARRKAGEYIHPRVNRKGLKLDTGGRKRYRKLDHPEGLEPSFSGPKPEVLPLDDG